MNREIKFRSFYDNRMHDNKEALRILYNNSTESTITPKYPVMQYTGLKDKNGVEIYEGDIIKANGGKSLPVEFINGAFMWYGLFLGFDEETYQPVSPEEWAEVIGNIYENPELLK